jgi:hypothetical protein
MKSRNGRYSWLADKARRYWLVDMARYLGLAVALAAFGALEVIRLGEARATVPAGWGAAIAGGAAASLVMTALALTATLVARRRSPRAAITVLAFGAFVIVVTFFVGVGASSPGKNHSAHPGAYAITTDVATAFLAYAVACLAQAVALCLALGAASATRQHRRPGMARTRRETGDAL